MRFRKEQASSIGSRRTPTVSHQRMLLRFTSLRSTTMWSKVATLHLLRKNGAAYGAPISFCSRRMTIKTFPRILRNVRVVIVLAVSGFLARGDLHLWWLTPLAVALLLEAEVLMILTDVDAVYADWGTPTARPLPRLTLEEVDQIIAAGGVNEGGMKPKVEAAAAFVRAGGDRAIVARLNDGPAALRGEAGTTIVRS